MVSIKNVILGIGIITVFALLLWQGLETFYPTPKFERYCNPHIGISPSNETACLAAGGKWISSLEEYSKDLSVPRGYCDFYSYCQEKFDEAKDAHSSKIFVISMIIGIIAILIGFANFAIEPVDSALMGSGIWAIFYGTVKNWNNMATIWRSFLLFLAFVLLIWIAVKLNKPKRTFRKTRIKK